ncbi:hypothetical protein M405DRAFT_547609 [Rhizopogon salebrosus TDB-379]|nr:hypothetical protein M405DRAFT_547609 [Rhizopogon salebrosus TDB-379]
MPGSDVQPISTPSVTRLFRQLRPRRYRTSSRSPPPTLNDTLPINEWRAESLYTEWALELDELLGLQQSFEYMQLQEAPVTSSHNFTCAICMEEQPVDNAVELDCSHPMCRDCVRGHICSKIEEHRFPVLCPVCVAEQDDPPGGMFILCTLYSWCPPLTNIDPPQSSQDFSFD